MKRARNSEESGIALLVVVIVLTIVGAVVAELTYNTEVNLAAAVNARDDLRAYYLARSGVNLARLLMKIQSGLIDPNRRFIGDLQIAQFAPYLVGAFNNKEEAGDLGGLLGFDMSGATGLGLTEGGTFDLAMASEDGKINVNCGGGMSNPMQQYKLATALQGLMMAPQYDAMLNKEDKRGRTMDRPLRVAAIIDYTDLDEMQFGVQDTPEDYDYGTREDPYRIKNQPFDTLEELRLVQGMDDEIYETFAGALTVYGNCIKVNVNEAGPLVLLELLYSYPADPTFLMTPEGFMNAWTLVNIIVSLRQTFYWTFTAPQEFVQIVQDPTVIMNVLQMLGLAQMGQMPMLVGIPLNPIALQAIDTGRRRVWRVAATAEVGHVHKQIISVWDNNKISPTTGARGGWVYWRED